MRTARLVPWSVALAGAVLVIGLVVAQMTSSSAGGQKEEAFGGQERLRDVTGAYHNEALAVAGGFVPEDVCVSSPDGGMGYHYPNESRMDDDSIHKDQPEILLYAPSDEGPRKLIGVEYWKADEDQDPSTDDDRPSLFGREFDGPMEGHAPGMPIHYDLHVWVWKSNPLGTFAPFNPKVSCE